jgi:hypothetical protein
MNFTSFIKDIILLVFIQVVLSDILFDAFSDDCFRSHASQKESNLEAKDIQQQQHEKMEPVKASDVFPNTPKADEAEI